MNELLPRYSLPVETAMASIRFCTRVKGRASDFSPTPLGISSPLLVATLLQVKSESPSLDSRLKPYHQLGSSLSERAWFARQRILSYPLDRTTPGRTSTVASKNYLSYTSSFLRPPHYCSSRWTTSFFCIANILFALVIRFRGQGRTLNPSSVLRCCFSPEQSAMIGQSPSGRAFRSSLRTTRRQKLTAIIVTANSQPSVLRRNPSALEPHTKGKIFLPKCRCRFLRTLLDIRGPHQSEGSHWARTFAQ